MSQSFSHAPNTCPKCKAEGKRVMSAIASFNPHGFCRTHLHEEEDAVFQDVLQRADNN